MNLQAQEGESLPAPVTGRIFVTGGTGFVGGNIIEALGNRPLRLLVRGQQQAPKFKNPNIDIVQGDVTKPDSLRGTMDGCEAVIHLVAIISEEGKNTFDAVIRQGAVNVINEAQKAGVSRFLQMSALGTRNDPRFGYFEAKWQAEQAVKQSGIPWTIFRPSVIFGPGDEFINTLAKLVKTAPVIPVVGTGQSKFQPVSVKDVATAFVRALDDPRTEGHIYDLGGGATYSYEEMLDVIAEHIGAKKPKVHVPLGLIKRVVALSKPLPKALRPPVTEEQLKMLAIDNATDDSATGDLIGRAPLKLEDGIDYVRGSSSAAGKANAPQA